ncbi:hypothetical protein BJ138DRAFT_1125863 [Hygrophoropsis aurantiaca]|uniref:Uncharacterized protein n=1 Tax=Hygrophoropsis aurantiaca TaxID=72124 RepID=A0ACB8AE84_9AGAM|nr:hypothetical protein BJ138DRAFT_1125863 [Hygrophoropsis aurantiaca]
MSTPLETEELDTGAAVSHAALDKDVLTHLHGMKMNERSPDQLTLSDLALVLRTFFNGKYGDTVEAQQLLIACPELQEPIREAFRERSFANVRNMKILWSSQARPVFDEWKDRAAMGAWIRPYCGESHRILLHTVNKMWQNTAYTNAGAIIQSHGSGKSRMVHELASLVFTIPFNLRGDAENENESGCSWMPPQIPNVAYPPPDSGVQKYLCQRANSLATGQVRVFSFLNALFRRIAKEVDTVYGGQQLGTDDLAQAWSRHLDRNRAELYGEVLAECKNVIEPEVRKSGTHAAQAHLKALVQSIARIAPKACPQDVSVVLYFDEAHELARAKVDRCSDGKTMYDVLCACLNEDFFNDSIFTLFLSTDPSIDRFEPPRPYRSSLVWTRPVRLQVPITESPFDCSPDFPIKPGTLTLADLSRIEFMAMFGRPLFWALLRAGASGQDTFDLARAKLLNNRGFLGAHDAAEPEAAAAVLDVLLALDYDSRRAGARTRQALLVGNHMRTAIAIPIHREYIHSAYLSEPVLAEAAACRMADYINAKPGQDVMALILKAQYTSGLLDTSRRGEVVVRMLLMKAYLKAVRKDDTHPTTRARNFSQGCSLVTFIQELFSARYANVVLGSPPDNVLDGAAFAKAFENSVVRFTHFVKAEDESALSTRVMVAAFIRGMAMIICEKHAIVDILIPVLLDRRDHLNPSAMTGLLVQVNLSTRKAGIGPAIDHEQIGFFPARAGRGDGRPYIALVANLNVRSALSSESATTATPTPVQNQSDLKPEPQLVGLKRKRSQARSASEPAAQLNPGLGATNNHPRYSIAVFGCSDAVYNVVSAADRSLYASLLEDRGLVDDHPYQDEENLSMLRKMKPLWADSRGCYGWIDVPLLKDVRGREDEEERVIVGPDT